MSYFQVINQLNQGQIEPIYLLYGTETYFIQQIRSKLREIILKNDEDQISHYDLEETPIEEVIQDVETYPFFGEKKLVIADRASFLQSRPPALPFKHQLKALKQYIQHPVDYSVLVLIFPEDQLDGRKKITKALKKHVKVVECQPIQEYELKKWIQQLAKTMNIAVDETAFEAFTSHLTTDLSLIQNELLKCALYVGEGGVITKEIADNLLSHSPVSSSLKLVDSVIEKDLHKAITLYKDLEKMNEDPIGLIALLAFQFRTILQVKLLKSKGYSEQQMQKKIGAHPYVIKLAQNRERRFTKKQLETIIDLLTKTDALIKGGRMEKEIAFEILLYNLMQSA